MTTTNDDEPIIMQVIYMYIYSFEKVVHRKPRNEDDVVLTHERVERLDESAAAASRRRLAVRHVDDVRTAIQRRLQASQQT